jgi:hypothetical protein
LFGIVLLNKNQKIMKFLKEYFVTNFTPKRFYLGSFLLFVFVALPSGLLLVYLIFDQESFSTKGVVSHKYLFEDAVFIDTTGDLVPDLKIETSKHFDQGDSVTVTFFQNYEFGIKTNRFERIKCAE